MPLQAKFLLGLCERPGQLGAINRLNDIKQGDRILTFVRLQRADQMQGDIRIILAQCRPFSFGFLNPVFAKQPVACCQGFSNHGGVKHLADRAERHIFRLSVRCFCCCADGCADRVE